MMIACERKGYVFAIGDGYMCGALHIERDDELFIYKNDAEAARAAEKDGISLIYGMQGVPDGVYIDTQENRDIIQSEIKITKRSE